MSRPPTARKDALAAFMNHKTLDNFQLMALWDAPRNLVYERVKNLIRAGLVVRTNPGTNPALFAITPFGKAAAEAIETEEPAATDYHRTMSASSMVANTIKTQPNSVFALSGERVQLSIKEQ